MTSNVLPSDGVALHPLEERRIIKQIIEGHKMAHGDTYFVLHSKWWSLWKDYVLYDEKEEEIQSEGDKRRHGQRPGPIDNDELLEAQKEASTAATDKLEESTDDDQPPGSPEVSGSTV